MTGFTAKLGASLYFLLAASAPLDANALISAEDGAITYEGPAGFTSLTSDEIRKFPPFHSTTSYLWHGFIGNKDRSLTVGYILAPIPLALGQVPVAKELFTKVLDPGKDGKVGVTYHLVLNGSDWASLERIMNRGPNKFHAVDIITSFHGLMFLVEFGGNEPGYSKARAVMAQCLQTFRVNSAGGTTETLDEKVARGFLNLEKQDRDGARREFKAALQENPGVAPAWLGLGMAEEIENDAAQIDDYNNAIKMDPHLVAAFALRSSKKAWLGDFDGALVDANQFIAECPDSPIGFETRGANEEERGDFAHARADLDKALALKPEFWQALRKRGWTKFCQGDAEAGAQDLKASLQLKRNDCQSFYDLACIDFRQGKNDAAWGDFQDALAVAQKEEYGVVEESQLFLWLIQARQGKLADANARLADYLKDNEWRKEVYCDSIAGYLLDQKTEAEALKTDETSPRPIRFDQNRAYFFIGSKHLIQGDKAAATAAFQKCIACDIPASEYTFLAKSLL